MSLFKSSEWFTTKLSNSEDSTFGMNSLLVTNFGTDFDSLIVSNYEGNLWICKPTYRENNEVLQDNSNPTDFLLEIQLPHPILQVKTGKFVSGSQNYYLGVLHPKSLVVYNMISKKGLADYGDQMQLVVIYEHNLKRTSMNFISGEFGGTTNRDFICVQSLDGMLSFFEQEMFAFCCFLPDFLLPGPLAYNEINDSFVTVCSNWYLQSFRYQSLCSSGISSNNDVTEGKKVIPEWNYNLSEAALDISILSYNSLESYIIILGEHNLYCFSYNGKLIFMKRLEYTPTCFHCYLLEPEKKLMIIIATDTNTILIYKNSKLQWSSQSQIPLISLSRGNFIDLNGSLVFLSEFGDLHCCYLGTSPSLYMIPPSINKEFDLQNMETELLSLQKIIKSRNNSNEILLANTVAEKELVINAHISMSKKIISPTNIDKKSDVKACYLSIELIPSLSFEEVQISVSVNSPLTTEPSVHFIVNMNEKTTVESEISLKNCYTIISLDVIITVSYITNVNIPRVLQKIIQVPLKLVTETCQPMKDALNKIIINTNQSVISLTSIFSEFFEENSVNTNAIGFKSISNPEDVVTIIAAKSSFRYRIQSNNFSSLNYITQELVKRLKKHFSAVKDLKITFDSQVPISQLLEQIDKHYSVQTKVTYTQDELSQYASQYRVIQRRLITKFKDKYPKKLVNLQLLMDDTFDSIFKTIKILEISKEKLRKEQCNLASSIKLIILLSELAGISNNHLQEIQSMLYCEMSEKEEQGWEEVLDITAQYLLRTLHAKSEKDKLRTVADVILPIKDIEKLKKNVNMILDELIKQEKCLDIPENILDFNIEMDATIETSVPIASTFLTTEVNNQNPKVSRPKTPITLEVHKVSKNEEEIF